ncbi:hypothetical protein ACFIN9_10525 [Streptomyces noursei]|uniref:hypothetical protein n=1 Tax=Streptomyces noursei TaxID=1971 RepID=UPI0006E1474F
MTCGLKTTTGADLLSWLADQLRASATIRANLPYLASAEEHAVHLEALRKEVTAALHDGLIEDFVRARATTDPGRPIPSLPFVNGIPADENLHVHLTASGAWREVDSEGHVVMNAGGQQWTFAAPVLAVVEHLTGGRTASKGELAVASSLPVGQLAILVTELVTADVAAVSRRR